MPSGNLTTCPRKRQSGWVNDIPTLQAYQVNDSLSSRVKILRNLLWSPNSGLQNPKVISIARQVTRACPGRDGMCELRAIYQFVVENVRYTGDVSKVDTFSGPLRTLQMGGEDCDGHSSRERRTRDGQRFSGQGSHHHQPRRHLGPHLLHGRLPEGANRPLDPARQHARALAHRLQPLRPRTAAGKVPRLHDGETLTWQRES